MDHEALKLGRISKPMETAIKENFGDNIFIYVSEEKLSLFATRWPNDYLKKVEEISRIIKKAHYIAYDENKKNLYLIDEYIVKCGFQKVVLELHQEKEGWFVEDIVSLSDKKLESIWSSSKINHLI